MYLGIEIGGTKLQLGIGAGDRPHFEALERYDVHPADGAAGILRQIETGTQSLCRRFEIERVGIGFGGPVEGDKGRVITSHQIDGWTDFPLVEWCEQQLGLPAAIGNDCDCAALAEARYGAGQGHRTVFYVTVGTGVGGGLVIGEQVHGTDRPAAAEIGHLRPGLLADDPHATVESLASGRGIESTARACLADQSERTQDRLLPNGRPQLSEADRHDLLTRCGHKSNSITARHVGDAAAAGNAGARAILRSATDTLGWAIAQVIALAAPNVVVVGGGVSLMNDELFLTPLREAVRRYVFPPLAETIQLAKPKLGEEVVVHGAIALAAGRE